MDKNFIPILKKDIEVTKFDENSYLVTQKDNEPIKISAFGKYIIDFINDSRSINDIFIEVRRDYSNFEIEKLDKFIVQLINNNFIENANNNHGSKKSIWKRISFIKLLTFNSDKYYKYFTELLNGKIVFILIFVSIFLLVSSIFHSIVFGLKYSPSINDYYNFRKSIYMFYPFFMLYLFMKIFMHESAHAIMCRYFKQEVRKIGIALYLFHPVFFTDTTYIWKESNKYKRIFVSLAGPIADLSFISFIYLCTTFFVDNSLYYNVLIVIIFISTLKSLFNLNPFIKLDGYYILMDFLEIPNLRKNSFEYLKSLIFFRKYKSAISAKKKLLFFFFGLFSSLMTVLFILSFVLYISYNIYNTNITN